MFGTIGTPELIIFGAVAAVLIFLVGRRKSNRKPAQAEARPVQAQAAVATALSASVLEATTPIPPVSEQARSAAECLEQYRVLIARGDTLPSLRTTSSGDACYTAETHAFIPTGEYDGESGYVDITDKGLFFTGGDLRLTCPWSRVLTIELEPSTLFVHLTNKTKPIEIDYSSRPEAELAHFIALTIWRRNQRVTTKRGSVRGSSETSKPETSADASDAPVGTTIDLPGSGNDFTVPIVGESYRQAALKTLGGDRRKRGEEVFFTAALVPEPSNAHDPHAVRVFIHGGGQVGYLAKDVALEYHAVAERLTTMNAAGLCRAKLIGGQKGKPSIGVILNLASPAEVLGAIAPPQVF